MTSSAPLWFAGRVWWRGGWTLGTCAAWLLLSPTRALAQPGGIPSIFDPLSRPADEIHTLSLLVLGVCAAILVVVAGLLVYAIVRFRARPGEPDGEPPQVYGSNQIELAWTVVPLLIVFVLFLVTTRTLIAVESAAPPPDGALDVRVIGHQWWWEFRYPGQGIVTANELHVPAGVATYLTLESADVVHSFWVPQLNGKTDVIPNRVNRMWIAPREPGLYVGQCAEYCGTQHARMLLRVIAHPPEAFAAWVAQQQQPAVDDPAGHAGRAVFEATACVNCHTVQGTNAAGIFGPDLTHLMSRATIAAGAAPNTPEALRAWITNPDTIKPGALMPAMQLDDAAIEQLVAYLTTLK